MNQTNFASDSFKVIYFRRDKNFSAVGTALSRKAKAISAQYEERHEAKTVSELKQFVAKLPQMQATKQSLALRKFFVVFFLAII